MNKNKELKYEIIKRGKLLLKKIEQSAAALYEAGYRKVEKENE